MNRRIFAASATLLLSLVVGCPATAQQLTRIVSYRDLDLTKPGGVQTFRRRVARAVVYVCHFPNVGANLIRSEERDCRRETERAALPKMLAAIELAQQRAGEKLASR
jgi:UrcA family protein